MDMSEHGICYAADEQSDCCSTLPDGGQEVGQGWFAGSKSGQLVVQSLDFCGQQSCEATASEQAIELQRLEQASGEQCPAEAIAPGEQSVEYPAVEPVIGGVFCCGCLLHFDAEGFEESAVLDSAGAGGFAAAAVEAGVEVSLDSGCEFESAIDDSAHEVDASAGAIVFVTGFDVGRAGGGTESAVDAVEKTVVGDGLSEDRERAGCFGLLCGHLGILTRRSTGGVWLFDYRD